MEFEKEIEIAASAERIWAVLMQVERWPEWTASITKIERREESPFGAGSSVRISQPKLPTIVWRVTNYQAEQGFTWEAQSFGTKTIASHQIEPRDGERCIVRLKIVQDGFLAPMIGRFTSDLTRTYIEIEAQGLKSRCENPTFQP